MKPIRRSWSALALTLGLSLGLLGLVGCPEGDEHELPGDALESEPREREREGPEERREGLHGDEAPVYGEGMDTQPPEEGQAPGEGMREEPDDGPGMRPVPNESGDPLYRDRGETGGGETPHPQQTQRDQIHPGQ